MPDPIIQTIIKEKKVCYFISPHFDDAIFSAGALLTYLAQHTKVITINIFTESEKFNTLSAKVYLKQCGYTDAKKLYDDRKSEDAKVFNNVADNVINLGFVDALWRKKPQRGFLSQLFSFFPELQVIYPTYRFHIIKGIIAKEDLPTCRSIAEKLKETIIDKNAAIFCPFSVGNHIDHVITRKACEDVFSDLIYWSDFPYNEAMKKDTHNFRSFSFENNKEKKIQLMKGYSSQYPQVVRSGFVPKQEEFFVKF
jgi:LmbE family N-acetylglucosaminyl deacetylase